MRKRVVVTGMGVVSPNAIGLKDFNNAIRNGLSGIKFIKELENLGLGCNVAGVPKLTESHLQQIPPVLAHKIQSISIIYGVLAGLEAWNNAGLGINEDVDWKSGTIMGVQTIDADFAKGVIDKVYSKNIRHIGGRTAEQSLTSSLGAYLSGYLGLGSCSLSNSSACATGTEAILMGYNRIKVGDSDRILVGSSEGSSPVVWAGLDRLRALNYLSNDNPEKASRPMSNSAKGLVPSCGAGALVLEELEVALDRKATIYAEVLGGGTNCGGQRNEGSMTKPNIEGMKRCISQALRHADVNSKDITLISGHLTATFADPLEVRAWAEVLNCDPNQFPYINSLKSMTGHCLAAAGSIESIAVVLQLYQGYIHPSINCEDIHPEISKYLTREKIPSKLINKDVSYVAKASFGFGDLNSCLIFKKFER